MFNFPIEKHRSQQYVRGYAHDSLIAAAHRRNAGKNQVAGPDPRRLRRMVTELNLHHGTSGPVWPVG